MIRHVQALADQGPVWTGDVPEYLTRLNTCRVFRSFAAPRQQRPRSDACVWTTSDVNAYHEARDGLESELHVLENGRLVSSGTMAQNPDPHRSPRRLSPEGSASVEIWDQL